MFGILSDKIIIEGVRHQDEKILNYIYDNYFRTVKTHVLNNSGSTEDVSDVFQDAIIILYQQITSNDLNLTTDLKGYFFGIAKNIWSAQLRKKQREFELTVDIPEEDDSSELFDPALEKILSRSLEKLQPDCQTILKLYYDGVSYEEIAVRMNLKNETYARRKKYLSKEALLDIIKEDPEYKEYQRFNK